MEIYFSSKKLEKMAYDPRKCQKEMGIRRAEKFFIRLEALKAAHTIEDLKLSGGRFHELKGNRRGQWACDLDHPYRLIIEPFEKPIPTNESGGFAWNKVKIIEVIEIVDYHD